MAIFIKDIGCATGDCPSSPCECPLPTLVCDSISASLTKCGFDEYGTPSSPPKIYLSQTLSGTLQAITYLSLSDCTGNCGYAFKDVFSGSTNYTNPNCTPNVGGFRENYQDADSCNATTFDNSDYNTQFDGYVGGAYGLSTNVVSTTVAQAVGPNVCQDSGGTFPLIINGNYTKSLSSEYATNILILDTVASLPAYPNTFSGTCSSYRNLSSDELTYTIRRFKYKFILPDLTGITCYKLTWNVGDAFDEYVWDGVATETPVYGPIEEPITNGTVEITSIVADCSCP